MACTFAIDTGMRIGTCEAGVSFKCYDSTLYFHTHAASDIAYLNSGIIKRSDINFLAYLMFTIVSRRCGCWCIDLCKYWNPLIV